MDSRTTISQVANGTYAQNIKESVGRSVQGVMLGAFCGLVLSKLLRMPWYLGIVGGASIGFFASKQIKTDDREPEV